MSERARRAYELVRELDHPRPEERKAAADGLVALGHDAEPALTEALQAARDIKVRRRILLILREIAAPKAIPALLEYVLERDADAPDDTRALALRAIIDALKPRHARHVFDTFVQLRRDPETMVQVLALEGLARLGDPRALRFLEEAARNTDAEEQVSDTAARLLATFVESSPAERGSEETYTRQDLVHKLASRDAFQRELAIDELIARDLEPFDAFLEALRSSHDLARQSGIMGLGRLGDPRAFALLRRLVEHESSRDSDRALALRALSNFTPPPDIDRQLWLRNLERLLGSDDIFVISAALRAIAQVPHPDALAIVARRLEVEQPWLRDSAAEALASAVHPHDKHLLKPLAEALAESGRRSQERRAVVGDWPADEATLQQHLLAALNRIAQPDSGPEHAVVATVARYLAHPRAEIRAEAEAFLATVAQRPGDLAEPTLKSVLEILDSQRAGAAQAALTVLERTLPDPAPFAAPALARLTWRSETELVLRGIELLRRCGDSDEAQRALGRLASDPRPEIADPARSALLGASGGTLQ